jgi:hypothetical protein
MTSMNGSREAEVLVELWQELQSMQVAGDTRGLAGLQRFATEQSSQPDASPEWQLLAREAGRHIERAVEQVAAQPTVGAGSDAGPATYELEEVAAPDAAREPAEEGKGRGRSLGQLIWVVLILGYLLLQVIGNLGD